MKEACCRANDSRTVCFETGLRVRPLLNEYGIDVTAKYMADGDVQLDFYEVLHHDPRDRLIFSPTGYRNKEPIYKTRTGWEAMKKGSQKDILEGKKEFSSSAANRYTSHLKLMGYNMPDSFTETVEHTLEECIERLVNTDIV